MTNFNPYRRVFVAAILITVLFSCIPGIVISQNNKDEGVPYGNKPPYVTQLPPDLAIKQQSAAEQKPVNGITAKPGFSLSPQFPSGKFSPLATTLVSDVTATASTDPALYSFTNNYSYWCAVGTRPNTVGEDWDILLYSDDGFTPPALASSTNGSSIPVDFIVIDNNHAPQVLRGIKADRYSGSNSATIEYEGYSETLLFGANNNIDWPAGDVVEMWDISLQPGTYVFNLTLNSGTANLGFALFGSNGAAYYAGRSAAMASADANGNGLGESFTVTITTADWYGLCVWANNANAANFNINIGVPGQWLGTVSSDWNTAANWGAGIIPNTAIDVNIASGTPYSPVTPDGYWVGCKNLTIGANALLTLGEGSNLSVAGNFNSNLGRFQQTGILSLLYFTGSTNQYWEDGNHNDTYRRVIVAKSNPAVSLIMIHDMTLLYGFKITEGAFEIGGSSTLTVGDDLIVDEGGKLILNNGTLNIDWDLDFYDGSQADISGGTINIGHDFIVRNNTLYNIQLTGGTVVFNSSVSSSIKDLDGYTEFYNIRIQKTSGTCYIANYDLMIMNDLEIVSGTLSCKNGPTPTATYNIWLGGDWWNTAGPASFDESTSTVYFDGGNYHQYCSTETFNTLVVNKVMGGSLRMNGSTVTCASYDWAAGSIDVLPGGHFIANDLADNGIAGNFYLNNTGQIDLTNTDGYVDLNGNLFIYGGTFNVHGGTTMSYWPFAANASITMSGGILDFKDQGIRIHNAAYTLTENITGGIIRTAGNLHSYRAGFQPDAGDFTLYGPADANIYQVAGSSLFNLNINKATVYPAPDGYVNPFLNFCKEGDEAPTIFIPPTDIPLLNLVSATSDLDINGNFTITSGIFDPPANMYVAGNWANYAGDASFLEAGSKIIFDGSNATILTNETYDNVDINKTNPYFAVIEAIGNITMLNNLNLIDGTLMLNSNKTLIAGGYININEGAGLNASVGDLINIYCGGQWIDLNASFGYYTGFNAGIGSTVTFNALPSMIIQIVKEPNPFNNVVIASQAPYVRPDLLSRVIHCNNLNIQSGMLNVSQGKIYIEDNLDISGQLTMNSLNDTVVVENNVFWYSGSTDDITNGKFFVGGEWTFQNGTNASLGSLNTVFFNRNSASQIRCDAVNASFGSLVIEKTAGPNADTYIYGLSTDTMRVSGTMTVKPGNRFHVQSKKLIVDGTLDIQNLAELDLTIGYLLNKAPHFSLPGTLDVHNGHVLIHGYFELETSSRLDIVGGSFKSDAPFINDWQLFRGTLNMSGGILESTNGQITITSTAINNITAGTIIAGHAFIASDGAGNFQPSGGKVKLTNTLTTGSTSLYCDNGNFFHKLEVSGKHHLETDIIIKNDLLISAGYLNCHNYDIEIGGDWTNEVGPSGFQELQGKVVFNGNDHQHIFTNETFYTLEIDKPFGDLRIPTGTTTTCQFYDWTNGELEVNGGTFIANDLLDNGLFGKYYITNLGGLLEVHQDAAQYIDLNGRIAIVAGEMHVYGGNGMSYWPYAADAYIWMFGGVLDFKDNGIYLNPSAYNLDENITNGLIRVNKSFISGRPDFNPAGGTLELYGSDNAILSHGVGSSFNKVLINKSAGSSVDLSSNPAQINGDLTAEEGTMILNSVNLCVNGDVHINDGGSLQVNGASMLTMTNANSINVNNGGLFEISSSPGVNPIIKAENAVSNYNFNINSGGNISAENATFRNMGTDGIKINPGALVNAAHAFLNCTFEEGAAGGTLLTINNSQDFIIDGAVFPANTWGGANNVSKTMNAGSVFFSNYSGGFAGEDYDDDAYNLIDWALPLSLTVQAVPDAICAGASSQLQANATGGTPPYSYNWNPVASLSDPAIYNPIATPATTSPYFVTVTDFNGLTESSMVVVTVNPMPLVSCPADFNVCLDNGIFYLESLAVSPPSNSASSVFTGPGVIVANASLGWYDFDPITAGAGTHTITYTYTDVNGCSDFCTFQITVNALPIVTCPLDTIVCLYDPPFALVGGSPYGGNFSGPGVTANYFNPGLVGPGLFTITYTYTNSNGCSDFCTFTITVFPIPMVTFTGNISVCINATAFLLSGGIPFGGTYSGPGVIGNTFDPVLAGLGSHVITYTYTDGYGCSNATSFIITVHELPLANAGSDLSIAAGTSTTLNGSATGGNPPYAFAWNPTGSLSNPNIQNPNASPAETTTYTLTVTDANGCTDTDEVTVFVLPAVTVNLTGTITYNNTASSSLSNVTVNLLQSGVTVYTSLSGVGGSYEFTGITSGDYQLRCTTSTPWGGVNSADALMALKHFTGSNPLTGMSLVAANVDLNSTVNSIDALMIARRFTGIIPSFPAGDWAFQGFTISIEAGATLTQHVKGICYGDPSNSYLPPYKTPSNAELSILGELEAEANSIIDIPVTCMNSLEAGAISLVIDYPDCLMDVIGISAPRYPENLLFNQVNGTLRISWYSDQDLIFSPGEALIIIRALVSDCPNGLKLQALSESDIADHLGVTIPACQLFYPKVTTREKPYGAYILAYPNPFSDFTEFEISTRASAEITTMIYNAAGQTLLTFRQYLPQAGLHQVIVDGSSLAEGYYSCLAEVKEIDTRHYYRLKLLIIR